MNVLNYIIWNIIGTCLRGIPIPGRTGLIKIGNPGRSSPVFLTGNFILTIERVKKALTGIDCYLLVANSKGINVWCGAAGGHFTNHSVISVLKTSGIGALVDHKRVILPQLAATGVQTKIIREKTGWGVIWGPVYAKDIQTFVENECTKTPEMREVRFPLIQRIEMAIMWAFPLSIIVALPTFFIWRTILMPLITLIWVIPILIFASFPFYSKWLNQKKREVSFSKYTVFFDFGRIPLTLWVIFLLCLLIYGSLLDILTWGFFLRWGFVSFVIIILISIDLMGSTPVYKSGIHKERLLEISIDEKKCKGEGICEQVCPRNCYHIDRNRHIATIPGASRCVQCGACIVQCPGDALYFKGVHGTIVSPETIRKFKLNLIGERGEK
jgi:NAD-dependent dihydropyrimidine dehydrogenase PreA subunit